MTTTDRFDDDTPLATDLQRFAYLATIWLSFLRQRSMRQIHALADSNGLPVRLALTPGEAHGNRLAGKLLSRLKSGSMLLADRGYDADWIRELAMKKGA